MPFFFPKIKLLQNGLNFAAVFIKNNLYSMCLMLPALQVNIFLKET